jgi:hypothetical protein
VISDTTTDAAGNRYSVGYTYDGSYHGFLLKVSKKGFHLFDVDATSTSGYTPISVAADNMGHVYTAIPNGSSYCVKQFDASSGALNYTTPDFTYNSSVGDMVAMPSGEIAVVSDSEIQSGTYSATIVRWQPGGYWDSGYFIPGANPSHVNSLAVDASGGVYGAGYQYADWATSSEINGLIQYISPGFQQSAPQYYDSVGLDEYFTEVAVDPVTQVAVGVGGTYPTGFADAHPIVGTYFADYSTSVLVPYMSYYPFSYYETGTIAQGIAIGADGKMYMAVSRDITGTPRASIYTMYADSFSPWYLYYWWDTTVPATDTGTYDYAYDIATDSHGPVLGVVSDLTVGLGSSSYEGIQVFTFTQDGAPINRTMFGAHNVQTVDLANGYWNYPRQAMSTVGGYLSIYGYNSSSTRMLYTGLYKEGANDVYRVNEDNTLTVGLAKSVLGNDGNKFLYDPLISKYLAGSASAGIQTLTMHDDGTFSAVFTPNFNGIATFNYRVRQNGVFIQTNQVTIKVKATNDAPTAVDDSFNVAMNSAVQNLNVLGNDSDLDGDTIKISSKTNNPNATIGISGDQKWITFKPKAGFTGNVGFDYTIKDTKGATSTAHVVVHVI